MSIKTPKKFKGIPKKRKPEYKISETILKKQISIKHCGVQVSAIIDKNEISIIGIGPQPDFFKFKNIKSKVTLDKWTAVLDSMKRLVREIKTHEQI